MIMNSQKMNRERCIEASLARSSIREGIKKTFFWETFPKSVYPPTHTRVFVRFGKTKGEIWVKKGDFRGDFWGFEGFGPCLGISHPINPHLGEISQKKRFFWTPSLRRFHDSMHI